MSELLATNDTKKSLTTFLMEKSLTHLQKRNIKFVIAGNGITYSSFHETINNNHEEADTLIINMLCIFQPINKNVIIHSVDTDVFILLLRHYEKIVCKTW